MQRIRFSSVIIIIFYITFIIISDINTLVKSTRSSDSYSFLSDKPILAFSDFYSSLCDFNLKEGRESYLYWKDILPMGGIVRSTDFNDKLKKMNLTNELVRHYIDGDLYIGLISPEILDVLSKYSYEHNLGRWNPVIIYADTSGRKIYANKSAN